MTDLLHLTIRYEDAGDGWLTAQVAEVPGAISQGKTKEEARSNVIDALDVLLTPDKELEGRPPAEGSEALTLKVAS
jgi:predicted RNase H-like HicB family nuclease